MSTRIENGAIIIDGKRDGGEHDHGMTCQDIKRALSAFEILFGDAPRAVQVRFDSVPAHACHDGEYTGSIDWSVAMVGRVYVVAEIKTKATKTVVRFKPHAAVGLQVRLMPR